MHHFIRSIPAPSQQAPGLPFTILPLCSSPSRIWSDRCLPVSLKADAFVSVSSALIHCCFSTGPGYMDLRVYAPSWCVLTSDQSSFFLCTEDSEVWIKPQGQVHSHVFLSLTSQLLVTKGLHPSLCVQAQHSQVEDIGNE